MAGTTGYGVYRILKARVDMGHGGDSGKFFAYVLYDNREVRIFHSRLIDGQTEVSHGIKSPWRDFTSFVDGGLGEPLSPDIAVMSSDLAEVIQEVGVFDLKEDNLTKLRYMEKVFSNRAAQIYDGPCVAFLKIEGITSLEAEELRERFPAPKAPDSEDGVDGDSELPLPEGMTRKKILPKLVFSCSAVLDPVRGIPASEVQIGDLVTVAIPEDSPLYGTMRSQSDQEGRPFDGKVDLILTALSESDSDRLILEFELSDDVVAVVMAQKSLRIKALAAGQGEVKSFLSLTPPQLAFVGVTFLILIAMFLFVIRG